MVKLLSGSIFLLTLASCNNDVSSEKKEGSDSLNPKNETAMNNSLSDGEKSDGWQLLFDGQTINGWHKYGGEPAGSSWKVADSSLYLDASAKEYSQNSNGGDIVTDDEYENFHLSLDWKIDTSGNSGVMFYIHEDKTKYEWPWNTGPEMQVLDNNRHADAKINKHRAGDLYDLIASSKETVKPALEWNHVEIKCLGGKLDFFLNGENIVSTTLWDDNWKKLVAGSKFKDMPVFGTFKKGRIGLQDHGNNVWFRNIKIKTL